MASPPSASIAATSTAIPDRVRTAPAMPQPGQEAAECTGQAGRAGDKIGE